MIGFTALPRRGYHVHVAWYLDPETYADQVLEGHEHESYSSLEEARDAVWQAAVAMRRSGRTGFAHITSRSERIDKVEITRAGIEFSGTTYAEPTR